MRSLVVVRCCLIVCLVSLIGPRIHISDNGRHDADKVQLRQRSIKKVESYLPACNVFGGIWRSFSGAAYWMVCNSCLRVASPLAKPASTQ